MKKIIKYIFAFVFIFLITGSSATTKLAMKIEGVGEVRLSPQSIYINEKKVGINAFLVDNSNYFLLRDIGAALDFDIQWDDSLNSIFIDTTRPYTPGPSLAKDLTAANIYDVSEQNIYVNGVLTDYYTYYIAGNIYIKLRDVGAALNIGADWDERTKSVMIDTSKEYTPEKKYDGPELTQRERAGDEFFSDAAFIGNSLVDGLRLYSGLTADFYAVTSFSVFAAATANVIRLNNGAMGTVYQAAAQKTYGKIYILFGINEIGYETAAFKNAYGGMIDRIIELQPGADIYIMSLSPVSAAKSSASTTFTMRRVHDYNTALYDLAAEKKCYYIDLIEALADDTGHLPAHETWDGVHLTAGYYKVWAEYLKTRYK